MSLRTEAGDLKYGRDVELFFNGKQHCKKLQLLPWVNLIFFTLMQNQMQMVGTLPGNFFKSQHPILMARSKVACMGVFINTLGPQKSICIEAKLAGSWLTANSKVGDNTLTSLPFVLSHHLTGITVQKIAFQEHRKACRA